MRSQIIQIGNSQGIRIPKAMLAESGISGEVELEICEDGILIRNIFRARADWDKIFRELAETEDDLTLGPARSSNFDREKWQW